MAIVRNFLNKIEPKIEFIDLKNKYYKMFMSFNSLVEKLKLHTENKIKIKKKLFEKSENKRYVVYILRYLLVLRSALVLINKHIFGLI